MNDESLDEFELDSVSADQTLDRVAATIDHGQGITAARLMALQLVGGVPRTGEEWHRGRINIFIFTSPRVNIPAVFERTTSIFGGVRWYNAPAIDGDELFFTTQRRENTIEEGVLFEDATSVLYLVQAPKLRPSDRTELQVVLNSQTYPVRDSGIKTVLKPSTGVVLTDSPRNGTWDLSRSPASQISAPETFLGGCDVLLTTGHPQTEYETVTTDPFASDFAYEYIRTSRLLEPEWTEQGKQRVEAIVDKATTQIEQTEDDDIKKLMRLQSSDLTGTIQRFAEAHAKIHRHEDVSKQNVESVITLLTDAWEQIGFNTDSSLDEKETSPTEVTDLKKQDDTKLPDTTEEQTPETTESPADEVIDG